MPYGAPVLLRCPLFSWSWKRLGPHVLALLVCRWLLEPLILLVSLLKFVQISRGSYRSFSSWGSLFYEFAMCRVHKPGVPHGPASQQRIGPADDVANDAQLLGRPKKPNDRPGAIQSSTGRPGQRETALASDSGPPLQPEGLAKNASDSDPHLRPGTNLYLQLFFD